METEVKNTKKTQSFRNGNDAENSSRTCILVLGMHRSGTSAITRVLNLMGAALPQNILGANKGNEAGHWEPEKLIELHDELLTELDSTWADWRSIDLNKASDDRYLYYKNRIQKIIKEEYKDSKLFVLKDPRICQLLPFYSEVLEQSNIKPKIVFQFRNPMDVMDSLRTRNEMLASDAALLWLQYVLSSEKSSRDLERVFIKYDDVLNDWRTCHEMIVSSLDVDWLYTLDEIEDQVDRFISPKHCHHSHKDEEVLFDPLLRQWVGETYAALLVLQKSPNSENAQKRLDEIADEFEKASPMLVKVKSSITQSFKSLIAEKEQLIAECEQKINHKNELITEYEQQITQKDKLITEKEKSLSEKNRDISDLNKKINFKDQTISKKLEDIIQLRNSTSWKITAPVRALSSSSHVLFKILTLTKDRKNLHGGYFPLVKNLFRHLRTQGIREFYRIISGLVKLELNSQPYAYKKQITNNQKNSVTGKPRLQNLNYHWTSDIANPDKKNILIISHMLDEQKFGAENSLNGIIASIDRSNYNIHLVFPKKCDDYFDKLKSDVQSISCFSYSWRSNKAANKTEIATFKKLLISQNIDLVHSNTVTLQSPLIAAKELDIPSVLHCREILITDPDLCLKFNLTPEQIEKQINKETKYCITNSEFTDRTFNFEGQRFCIHNEIDSKALNIPNIVDDLKIYVGLISSNIPKKGIEDFVKLATLAKSIPNLTFRLIGPENRHIETIKSNLPENLEIIGYQETPKDAISKTNIVINLSKFSESFGRTVAEAMAAGRPVIAYNWGAIPELIRHDKEGFLIPFMNFSKAIQYLKYFANNPEEINRIGENGRARASSKFSRDVFSKKLNEAYHDIFENHEAKNSFIKKTNPKLNLAYFIWHFPTPSETFVLNELKYLVEQGYNVKVFCRQSPYPDFKPDFPITWERVDSPELLAQKLMENKIEIVHAHFTYPVVTEFVWPACESCNIPFTFIAHAQDIFRYANDEKNRIDEISHSPLCKKICVLGKFHRDFLLERGVAAEKIIINPQVADISTFKNAYSERFPHDQTLKVCAVQRFVEKKGLCHLIDAGKLLEKDGISIDLFGYGPLEADLSKQIQKNKINNVNLCGAIKSPNELVCKFKEYDLLVAPSVRAADGDMDGIPTILVEAMAAGVPVLTTPIASTPDLITDNITGFFCEPNDPNSIVESIRAFYKKPQARIETLCYHAHQTASERHNTDRLMRNLIRIWSNQTIDIVIVSWNNLAELREVINRIYKFTKLPFQLTIVDNNSTEEDVGTFLLSLENTYDNVKIILNSKNVYVGPATNQAIDAGNSDYVLYVCAKEGYALQDGWEAEFIDYMSNNPRVGLAGTFAHNANYLSGKGYLDQLPTFESFRNKEFATNNPDRTFRHIQGGLFVLRRAMYEDIGGFNLNLPHDHTDVEYSYYVEANNWELGEIPKVLAMYEKTKPNMFSRITENHLSVHPGSLKNKKLIDSIANDRIKLCNVCEWSGEKFEGTEDSETCPSCFSIPSDRALYHYLNNSILLNRRLLGLCVNAPKCTQDFWKKQFQGNILSLSEFEETIRKSSLPTASQSLDIVYCNNIFDQNGKLNQTKIDEIHRVLSEKGVFILRNYYNCKPSDLTFNGLISLLSNSGLNLVEEKIYRSSVVKFDWIKLLILQKD
ncbi:MAG: glycosyltransferase [Hyphomicrobiales bacterium]